MTTAYQTYDLPGSLYSVTLGEWSIMECREAFLPCKSHSQYSLRKMSKTPNISLPYKNEQIIMPHWMNSMVSVTWLQIPHI